MATVPEQIFKAYDVRGLYGDEIDEDIAEQLGRAFVAGSPTWRARRRVTCGSGSGATCG